MSYQLVKKWNSIVLDCKLGFEIVLESDDCYPKNTLLWYTSIFNIEINLNRWDNYGFKHFINSMIKGVDAYHNLPYFCNDMKMKYDNSIKKIIIPLCEYDGSSYHGDDIYDLNDEIINKFTFLHDTINQYVK